MIPFVEQAQFYAPYHEKPITRYIHMAAVPMLLLSLMILLGFVRIIIHGVLNTDLADLVVIGLLIYYFRLNWHLALAVTPLLILLLWIAEIFSYQGPNVFSLWGFVITFILGVGLMFLGYFFEGKRPPLGHNLWHILAAPLFLMAEVFFLAGRMKTLRNEIHGEHRKKVHHKK